jgi:uncharacterized repeat protein (TIGR03803 family)
MTSIAVTPVYSIPRLMSLRFMKAFVCFLFVASTLASGQTFSVIHTFTGGGDGGTPLAGLAIDGADNLYGTTYSGGDAEGDGIVFRLKHSASGWVLSLWKLIRRLVNIGRLNARAEISLP